LRALPLDEVLTCFHDDADDCPCRKPRPGLLTEAAARLQIDLDESFMVGDRWRDVEAGRLAGCRTVFVDFRYDEALRSEPSVRTDSLGRGCDWILSQASGDHVSIPSVDTLAVKVFADGANLPALLELYRQPYIKGFTTNPTLMNQAGLRDYRGFAHEVLAAIPDRPISFEVFSDEFDEMERQGREIATWGENVYVKIPITNTRADPSYALIRRLSHDGIKLNVTAMMTLEQVRDVVDCVRGGAPSCISVFAGRIADTGRDPVPIMAAAVELLRVAPDAELIWASPRELLNIFQADAIGCHIITVTPDILKKLVNVGRDLADYSLDTVKMFRNDALKAGFTL
jgi:transaldolase